jgi:hypothetical protein
MQYAGNEFCPMRQDYAEGKIRDFPANAGYARRSIPGGAWRD